MKKSNFALFIDSLFLSFSITFIIYLWLNKIYKNANLVNFISIIVLILSFILFLFFFFKHNNKLISKSNNEKFLNKCINSLILSSNLDYKNFICKLLNCSHIENYTYKLEDKIIYINIKTELSSNDYFNMQEIVFTNSIQATKLYFIYKTKNKSFDDIISISNYEIELISFEILAKLMTQKNIYPIQKESTTKHSLKNKIINNFKKQYQSITNKHFKEFFFSGLSLLFLSIIVPFSNYYLITGTILLIISIFSLFRKNIEPSSSNTDFLFEQKQK